MFSGLTNQVSSWMGSTKPETHEEEVPAAGGAPGSATAATRTEEENLLGTATAQPLQHTENVEVPLEYVGDDGDKKQSPTKAGGLFSGVKSQMTGWLGNASIPSMPAMPAMPSMPSIPHIPGLRKHNAENEAEGGVKSPSGEAAQQPLGDSDPAHGDDEDKSRYISATEGADSGPSSPQPGTPTDEQAGQIGNVTTKVTQSAKTFGSFLYSAVNKAGAKIKKTHILGEFNKEQEAFMKSQTGKTDAAVPPWIGHNNESSVKDEILTLSSDRRNFVRAPPAGVEFEFSYDASYSVALAIMAEDPALEKMRFELVPKIITEENFWRNYFYRVSLICQAGDLGTLGEDSLAGGSNEDADDKEPKKDADEIVVMSENLEQKASNPSDSSMGVVDVKANDNVGDSTVKNTSNVVINNNNNQNKKKNSKKIQSASNSNKQRPNESEFVSDTFQTTESDLKEVEDGMRILGIDTLAKQALENDKYMDEQWEKDLEAELQEYEMVVDDKQDINWEADVDELLNDATDLK